jgi:hypothetical protein
MMRDCTNASIIVEVQFKWVAVSIIVIVVVSGRLGGHF